MRATTSDFGCAVRWICLTLIWAEPMVLMPPDALPKKHPTPESTEFHHSVLISSGGFFRIGSNSSICIDPILVFLTHETFFDRLTRVRGLSDLEWRYIRDGKPVEEFPESLSLEICAVPSWCSRGTLGYPDWNGKLWDFMDSLSFVFRWVKSADGTPAQVISMRTSALPEPGNGGAPQWRYYFQIEAGRVPITDSLSVQIFSGDGRELTRVVSGMERASPWPP